MLVLNRDEGERVLIRTPSGEEIWITVIRVQGGKVRLGFDAPRTTVILREEAVHHGD